ncbi:hypothetical protein [Listeria innocua]|uniref:hypothetical protein n=1 Tax=Listeria innocua TaxID=1642 RepID=UPI00086B5348|nr:hypothetical protein [Listeria innocua]EAH3474166.1 hypothetical protein [Listeria monocytogenes]EHE1063240.1 hypothetical protein [Listeria monocytogenes]MBF2435678.1 hypothetical protein [Listeria innocua]MDG0898343.1 hypothetical protein [Listeria innocua]MDH4595450.1 hypothetical protein [Listeria innocua]
MKLLSLIMKVRIGQEISLLKRILTFLNKALSIKLYIVTNILMEIVLAILTSTGLYLLFKPYLYISPYFYILLIFLLAVTYGSATCYRTHVFPFEEFRERATIGPKKVSFILTIADLLYLFIFSSSIFLTLLFLTFINIELPILKKVIVLVLVFFMYICVYFISNRIFGRYIYHKILRKIGIVRILFYIIFSSFFVFLGSTLVLFIVNKVIFFFHKYFININSINNEKIWNAFSKDLGTYYLNTIKSIFFKFISIFNNLNIFWIILFASVLILLTFILLLAPIKFIPIHKNEAEIEAHDLCNSYVSILNKLPKQDILFKNNLVMMRKKRWLFAKNFLQYIFLTYESFFYIGVMLTIVFLNQESGSLQTQLLFLLNYFVMANQTFEVREELYPYFSLGIEREHFILLKSSPVGVLKVYNSKVYIYRLIFLSSTLILVLLSTVMFCITAISLINYLFLLGTIAIAFYIFPLIQMYMVPLATKLDYTNDSEIGTSADEEFILSKFQTAPRWFLNMIPLVITVIFIFLKNEHREIALGGEMIYLLLVTLIFTGICKKTIEKGMTKINEIK